MQEAHTPGKLVNCCKDHNKDFSQNVEQCYCKWHQAAEEALDLTQKSTGKVEASKVWIKNALYVLHDSD